MRRVPQFLLRSLVAVAAPVAAHAAGTYYTGGYQSPQTARYGQNYSNTTGSYSQYSTYNRTTGYSNAGGYNRYGAYGNANNGANTANRYGATGAYNRNGQQASQNQPAQSRGTNGASSSKSGFFLGADISHEYAMWQFDMNQSGSILHYDDIAWNALNLNGGYVFDLGNTKLQLDAGFKYAFQSGESTMVDDDITNGGYLIAYVTEGTSDTIIGQQIGHAMSVGTSKSGSMLGFNVGLGLTDIFSWGSVKMTPSVGYRYLKYKLETHENYGVAVDTAACFTTEDGETQCDPIVVFIDDQGNASIIWRKDIQETPNVPSGSVSYDTEGTFYFQQPGVSHSYEVEWSGPYIALDMDYTINQNNAVNGRVELGFPGYTSTGDQPYRFDWAHPKSVEDKAGMFSAFHLGLGANWQTALSNTVMLTIGLTYDYYTVSDADATTYLNGSYYEDYRDALKKKWDDASHPGGTITEPDINDSGFNKAISQAYNAVNELEKECPGWVCSLGSEVNSFYRSLGVRVGINAKF